MARPPWTSGNRPHQIFKDEASSFFEVQLKAIGLGREQIERQTRAELEDSLVRVDDALRAPESFGVLRLRVTATAGSVIVGSNSESHIELGVVPILLERKMLIAERLRELRTSAPITTLDDLLATVPDNQLREQLVTELVATRRETARTPPSHIRQGYAFIAMAMDPQDPALEDVIDAIKEAAQECSIVAERIDDAATNERITDRVLAAIGEAEFVVVDLTHARPNVYYEAGYAQALGKTPIFVARIGTEVAFDLKDYPIIFYPNMRGLRISLAERLTAIRSGRNRA